MAMDIRNHNYNRDTLKRTSSALTPCDRVLGLPELQELIFSFVGSFSIAESKKCTLVCRRWRSHLAPSIWKSVTMGSNAIKGIAVLRKEAGMLVHRLTITCATTALIKKIPKLFPNVTYLSLAIGLGSDGIGYSHLQRLFRQLQHSLTEVQFSLEVYIYDVSIIWKELLVNGHFQYPITDHDWRLVFDKCRFLRILDIVDYGHPTSSFETLISSLPHLQVLSMNFDRFNARNPSMFLLGLSESLEQHQAQYGTSHPLRCLEIAGWITRPDEYLMSVIAMRCSEIESFRICHGARCYHTPHLYPTVLRTADSSSSSLSPSTMWNTYGTAFGPDLKDTLVWLDIAAMCYFTYGQGIKFYEELQEFRRLRVLYILPAHLWILECIHRTRVNNSKSQRGVGESSSSSSGHHQQETRHGLPETDLCFLSIENLYISHGEGQIGFPVNMNYSMGAGLTMPMALLAIATMPSLCFFSLGNKAAPGLKATLQKRFRHIVFKGD
ncbi:hypothetical protein BGZ96_002022 [Linnemannia gamsii]|uniref:F-box domain-containing protein n=1 Tax=Linnemannia gamsii TaxID=64522 RepID=A0ABQ7JLH0_9FUNG|nr:hypothetical protein BGZ96_002022 [Linnemannia gamsii]